MHARETERETHSFVVSFLKVRERRETRERERERRETRERDEIDRESMREKMEGWGKREDR